jgi:hypothetical protein
VDRREAVLDGPTYQRVPQAFTAPLADVPADARVRAFAHMGHFVNERTIRNRRRTRR